MKKFKDIIEEAQQKKVIYVDKTIWITNSQSSGTTIQLKDIKNFLSDDKSDSTHYDSSVKDLLKFSGGNKPLKQNKNGASKLFEIPEYPNTNPGTDKNTIYDIWGGNLEPIGKIYMIVTKEKHTIVNFFENEKEAFSWMNTLS